MTEVVPPRPAAEVREFLYSPVLAEPEAVEQWATALEAMLPPHAHREGTTFRWSNRIGLWEMFYNVQTRLREQPLLVNIRSGWDSSANGWTVADPHIGHLRSLLTVMGAIEPELS